MLPVATPPNAIIFGTQRLTIAQMARVGIVLNLFGIILITTAIYFFAAVILQIDPSQFPAWAMAK
jgi:sodium-dependent dicarboxylate transporter 2/3/5